MSDDVLARLEARILLNRHGDPATSYVAKLTARGRAKIAQKLGEEAVETVIAGMGGERRQIAEEAADLMFHLLLLLADAGLSLDDVRGVLEAREGVSGVEEKSRRK